MICPKCKSEVGNQSSCPYCGTVFYQDPRRADVTTPVNKIDEQRGKDHHAANIDTWGLVSVVLLSGIFLTEILQLVLQLAN